MDEDMESGDCRLVPLEFAADSCFRQPFHGRLCRFIRATGNNLPHKRCTSAAQPISMAGGAPRMASPALLTFHETQQPLAPAMLQCVANGCAGQGGGGTIKPSSLRFT
ncbi:MULTISPECIES: hypothetical protein [Delftia]|uniref:hypothetical protein n=1 Tax=Delftia TaxID=80865 RepID=UPI0012EC8EB6|nr:MULTISPECIES: hypothetical protein [Delftia]WAT88458.1 hypothetical protein O1V13_14790 [Delftia acidovorans]